MTRCSTFFGLEFNKILVLFGLQLLRQACEAPARKLQHKEGQDLEEIEVKKVEHRVMIKVDEKRLKIAQDADYLILINLRAKRISKKIKSRRGWPSDELERGVIASSHPTKRKWLWG